MKKTIIAIIIIIVIAFIAYVLFGNKKAAAPVDSGLAQNTHQLTHV